MKGLHKKIGAIALAGMVVFGVVGLSKGSVAHAIYISGYGEVSSPSELYKQEGFNLLYKSSSEKEVHKKIAKMLEKRKVPELRKRLLEDEPENVKNMKDLRKILESGRMYHKIKAGDSYYLLVVDKINVNAANNKHRRKYYDRRNQRSYDVVNYYSGSFKYNILIAEDCSYSGGRALMDAKIRSNIKDSKIQNELLKDSNIIRFKDPVSFESSLRSKDGIFKNEDVYYRIEVGNLQYVILKNKVK